MDYKDILAIVIAAALIIFASRFLPNNPLGMVGNYIRNLFSRRL